MVENYTNDPNQSKKGQRKFRDSINWVAISLAVNRSYKDCKTKWGVFTRRAHVSALKKGPFTAEEDEIMRQRATAWGDKSPSGLWRELERELGRPALNLRNHWQRLLRSASFGNVDNYLRFDPEQLPLSRRNRRVSGQMMGGNGSNKHDGGDDAAIAAALDDDGTDRPHKRRCAKSEEKLTL